MTHPPAFDRNRAALLRIVAVLFVYAGLDEGGADVVPRRVWRRIMRLLRPAEAAVRRLIVIAAQGIAIELPKPRVEEPPASIGRPSATGVVVIREGVNLGLARIWRPQPAVPPKPASALPAFALTDPPRRFDTKAWDGQRPFPPDGFEWADPDEAVSARNLCRRLLALKQALDDLPRCATRLARLMARRDLASKAVQGGFAPAGAGQRLAAYGKEGPKRAGASRRYGHLPPMRLGHPPGWRRRATREVDDVLRECHAMACHAMRRDSS